MTGGRWEELWATWGWRGRWSFCLNSTQKENDLVSSKISSSGPIMHACQDVSLKILLNSQGFITLIEQMIQEVIKMSFASLSLELLKFHLVQDTFLLPWNKNMSTSSGLVCPKFKSQTPFSLEICHWVWGHTPLILAPRRQRQVHLWVQGQPVYRMSFRTARSPQRNLVKTKTKTKLEKK